MINLARLGTLVFALMCIATINVWAQRTDWSWIGSPDRSVNTRSAVLLDSIVLSLTRHNVYRAPWFSKGQPILTELQHSYMYDLPRIYTHPSGVVFLAGSTLSQTAFGLFRLDTNRQSVRQLRKEELEGESFPTGFTPSDYGVVGPSHVRFGNAYSFDTGETWYRMRNLDTLDIDFRFVQLINNGVCALRASPFEWFVVDTVRREYLPIALDPNICRFAFLNSGAAMAVSHKSGDEFDIVIKRRAGEVWEPVGDVFTGDGVKITPKRSVFLNSERLHATKTNKAVFFLDSARVLEFNGLTVNVRNLLPYVFRGTLARHHGLVKGDSVVRTVYREQIQGGSFRFIVVDYSLYTEQIKTYEGGEGRDYEPIDVTEKGALSAGPYILEFGRNLRRTAMSAFDEDGSPIDQPMVQSVCIAGSLPWIVTGGGEVLAVDDEALLPSVASVSVIVHTTTIEKIIKRINSLGTSIGTLLIPSRRAISVSFDKPVINSGMVFAATSAIGTCIAQGDSGRLYLGGSSFARYSGDQWQEIPFSRAVADSGVVMSSLCVSGLDTVWAAFRGYSVKSPTNGIIKVLKGGLARSIDGGMTWARFELPQQELWVENVTKAPNGTLLCWAADMQLDSSAGSLEGGGLHYSTNRLYHSADNGVSWKMLFKNDSDEGFRTPAVVHQWSISFSPQGHVALTTPKSVYVASSLSSQFQEFLDLPFNESYGGAAFAPDGHLWVAGSHGVHKRSLDGISGVSSSARERGRSFLTVFPNPANDQIRVSFMQADGTTSLPERVTLTSLEGASAHKIELKDGRCADALRSIPAGAYIATAWVGVSSASSMVFIVR